MLELRVRYENDGTERISKELEAESFEELLQKLWTRKKYWLGKNHEIEILKKDCIEGKWGKIDLDRMLFKHEYENLDEEITSNGSQALIFRPKHPKIYN